MQNPDLNRQVLGQYELRELLGAGGMGSVYRAYQMNLRREVAIKILPAQLAATEGYLERFSREAATAAGLEHAHIIPVYDYGSHEDITYIVMRLLTGGTLSQRVAQHRANGHQYLALSEVATIVHQLASALDYAHSRGVIHRDIKPGNVMFDNQGNTYLVDFGIARLMEGTSHLTATGAMVGTPMYMSPEQWRSEPVTPAADQYSLAVMIYQLTTGHAPFETDTPYGLMHKHLNEPPTPPQAYRSGVPGAVSLVLERALAKQPDERFPTVTAFAQALSQAVLGVEDESTQFMLFKFNRNPAAGSALPFSTARIPEQPPLKPFYRSPVVWVAGVALLALVVIAAIFLTRQGAGAPPGETPTITAEVSTPVPDELLSLRQTNAALIAQVPSPSDTPALVNSPIPTDTATDLPTATTLPSATFTDVPPTATFTVLPSETFTRTPQPTSLPTETSVATNTLLAATPVNRLETLRAATQIAQAAQATLNAQIANSVTQTSGAEQNCSGSPSPTLLRVGIVGRVTAGGLPSRVRATPNTDGEILATIPQLRQFTVVGGPVCDDVLHLRWWQVDYLGRIGWTADGVGNEYYLEPAPGS